ncbi:MAG: hypothetical protein P8174_02425 [Gemmatimonadota bacterium]
MSARTVLMVGSARAAGTSTSEALGHYLLERLQDPEARLLHVNRLRGEMACQSLLRDVDLAGLVVLCAPLYVDSLPYLVIRAFERIARHRAAAAARHTTRLVAIINCGFPEAHQTKTALDICQGRGIARRAACSRRSRGPHGPASHPVAPVHIDGVPTLEAGSPGQRRAPPAGGAAIRCVGGAEGRAGAQGRQNSITQSHRGRRERRDGKTASRRAAEVAENGGMAKQHHAEPQRSQRTEGWQNSITQSRRERREQRECKGIGGGLGATSNHDRRSGFGDIRESDAAGRHATHRWPPTPGQAT